jgi:hypothetical protein
MSLFDPGFFCPSAHNALISLYRSLFTGPCDCVVDPSIDTVQRLLADHSNPSMNQRVVLHYFGFGCHLPTAEGSLFFFTENRVKYYPLNVGSYIQCCQSPLFLIFDCSNAGVLYKSVLAAKTARKLDLIALFSCGRDQTHPMATDLPLDLFSLCLLQPFQMSLWWHQRKYSHVFARDLSEIEKDRGLQGLFNALVDAIAVDSVSGDDHDLLFRRDSAVTGLCRGFLLAQRILSYFHLTCQSIPAISNCGRHMFWDFWEIAVDMSVSNRCDVNEAIFDILMKSFTNEPFPSAFPVLAYFMGIPQFHLRVVDALLKNIDEVANPADSPIARSQIWKAIVDLKKVSARAFILLAKLIASSEIVPFDQHIPLAFSGTSDGELLRAGMLAIACSFSRPCTSSYHRLSMVCVQAADMCAPISFLLFGLLADRTGHFLSMPACSEKFAQFLHGPQSDVRAAAVFALGCNREEGRVHYLVPKLSDPSWLVRYEAMLALAKMVSGGVVENVNEIIGALGRLEADSMPIIATTAAKVIKQINERQADIDDDTGLSIELPRSLLLPLLIDSVRKPGFVGAYSGNLFREDEATDNSYLNSLCEAPEREAFY